MKGEHLSFPPSLPPAVLLTYRPNRQLMRHPFIHQPILILLRTLHKLLPKFLGKLLLYFMELRDIRSVGGPNESDDRGFQVFGAFFFGGNQTSAFVE